MTAWMGTQALSGTLSPLGNQGPLPGVGAVWSDLPGLLRVRKRKPSEGEERGPGGGRSRGKDLAEGTGI